MCLLENRSTGKRNKIPRIHAPEYTGQDQQKKIVFILFQISSGGF